MRPNVNLCHGLSRSIRTRDPTAMQRLRQPEPTVLDDAAVREAIQGQVAARLLVGSKILMALSGSSDVVEFGRGVLDRTVIRDLNMKKKLGRNN